MTTSNGISVNLLETALPIASRFFFNVVRRVFTDELELEVGPGSGLVLRRQGSIARACGRSIRRRLRPGGGQLIPGTEQLARH